MSEAGAPGPADEAMLDLLVKQVVEGLSPDEQRELDVLDDAVTSEQRRGLERAAAALTLAAPPLPLPDALRARLEQQAAAFIAAPGAREAPAVREALAVREAPAVRPVVEPIRAAAPARTAGYGWFAAAACLLLALFGWFRTPPASAPPVAVLPPPVVVEPPAPAAPAPLTPAERRTQLLAQAGTLKITLGATKDPAAAGVTGDVVWDPKAQQGFLHFVGLAPNDPQVHEYQIWIFDAERDQRYPIDGGVFDVPAGAAEVVIPIHAALLVHKPAAFAVTVEKPGGVVVSSRDHVVVLGAAG
jgi:hypothetical protein